MVRPLLALFDINYDDLVRLEPGEGGNVSPYARAVNANPAVLERVFQSDRPVLAALQVALGFKPYAEFMDQYGEDPQSIRDAIRDEVKAELTAPAVDATAQGKTPSATPFSASQRQSNGQTKTPETPNLGDIFKK